MSLEDNLSILNPWWTTGQISPTLAKPYKRKAFAEAKRLFMGYRQVVMMVGLRRVGKSTIVYQLISDLLKTEESRRIIYFTFDVNSPDLIEILNVYAKMTGVEWKNEKAYVFLDELQKLPDWDSRLKVLYDSFPNLKFVVSGSASLDWKRKWRTT
ncbi:AAA family ATPase [Tardisphaera miroshnichenkoae]